MLMTSTGVVSLLQPIAAHSSSQANADRCDRWSSLTSSKRRVSVTRSMHQPSYLVAAAEPLDPSGGPVLSELLRSRYKRPLRAGTVLTLALALQRHSAPCSYLLAGLKGPGPQHAVAFET
jgi:hypothetical protein